MTMREQDDAGFRAQVRSILFETLRYFGAHDIHSREDYEQVADRLADDIVNSPLRLTPSRPSLGEEAPDTCGFCKGSGIAPWVMGDYLRPCGYCEKGREMEESGLMRDYRNRTLAAMPPRALSSDAAPQGGEREAAERFVDGVKCWRCPCGHDIPANGESCGHCGYGPRALASSGRDDAGAVTEEMVERGMEVAIPALGRDPGMTDGENLDAVRAFVRGLLTTALTVRPVTAGVVTKAMVERGEQAYWDILATGVPGNQPVPSEIVRAILVAARSADALGRER